MAKVSVLRGCGFACRFCPERFRQLAPGTIALATDLPQTLARGLGERARAGNLPREVMFNPGCDPFQPIPAVLSIVHECMRLLLEAGVKVRIKTRGAVPGGFESLLTAHARLLRFDVALVTMDEHLSQIYEPGAPGPQERLETLRRLVRWGPVVRARIEPLIPFVSDTAGHLEDLVRHLRSVGVEQAISSYLVLRPQVLEKMRSSLPRAHFELIKGSFKGRTWQQAGIQDMIKLMPSQTRRNGYDRLRRIAARNDLAVAICACQNPDMGQSCHPPGERQTENPVEFKGQLNLFKSA